MIFLQIIKRELKIATRKQAEILNPLWFFDRYHAVSIGDWAGS